MKITRTIKTEQNVRYLKASLGVRYWTDCDYSTDGGKTWTYGNTLDDTDEESERIMKLTPCVVRKNIGYRDGDYLELIIDLDEGKVINWSKDFCCDMYYKICDDGEYVFLDENMNEVVNITKEYDQYYVPDFLSLEDAGYGDYVYINIDGDGYIEHFSEMKDLINEYFEEINGRHE